MSQSTRPRINRTAIAARLLIAMAVAIGPPSWAMAGRFDAGTHWPSREGRGRRHARCSAGIRSDSRPTLCNRCAGEGAAARQGGGSRSFRLVSGKRVEVEPFQQDRYKRLVGIIYIGGINVNAELIRKGHAWAYRQYMRKADAKLCALEAEARLARRGLWKESNEELEAPWKWRNEKLEWVTDFSKETAADCLAAIGR